MKTSKLLLTWAALLSVAFTTALHAQTSAFTYQGSLTDNGSPASGIYNLRFAIFEFDTGGSPVASPITNNAVAVSNGLFTVTLDFGASMFDGSNRWIEIGAVTNGGGVFTPLTPRQFIASTPYAVRAANATSAASVAAENISGTIPLAQLPATVITNGATNVTIAGTFSGDGSGVTGVNLESINSQGAIMVVTHKGVFSLSSSPGVGGEPFSVTSADVNGDGWADLISANFWVETLTVLTNNRSGGFALSSSPAAGGPVSVTSADVNGDGWADLVSATFDADSLKVLTNNGSGGFALSSSPGVGDGPQSVTAADVNGDGQADLISANFNANTLTVLMNNGSGGFALSSSPVVGNKPYSVTAADVNGDGQADLISANSGTNTLTVLTNNGSGGFALSSSPVVGNSPYSVTSADVNGDGLADLISANEGANTLTVLTNNGSGGFALSSSPGVGNNPYSVTSADVNGDGKADLISANAGASTLTVLTNNGSGGFAISSSLGVGSIPFSVTSADVNGDGKADLISANYSAFSLTVLTNATTFDPFSFTGSFTGAGANLTGLNASELTSGTVLDARLSPNVAKLNAAQIFTGANTFNNAGNSFTGNGAGLTGLPNASALDAADGSPVNALLVNAVGNVGIGTTSPSAKLHIISQTTSSANNTADFSNTAIGPWHSHIHYGTTGDWIIRSAAVTGTVILQDNSSSARVGIGTGSPSEKLHVVGNIYASGTITPSSDRNLKKNFDAVNAQEVLARVAALPIQQWTYKAEDDTVRHVGPMAQDFHAAFGLGVNDVTIATVDADGVALAAIQGLNQKVESENSALRAENAELRQELQDIKRLLTTLTKKGQQP